MLSLKDYIQDEEVLKTLETEIINDAIKIREESKISQKNLAKASGLYQSAIARMEKNTHSPSLATLLKVLVPLGYKLKVEKITTEDDIDELNTKKN